MYKRLAAPQFSIQKYLQDPRIQEIESLLRVYNENSELGRSLILDKANIVFSTIQEHRESLSSIIHKDYNLSYSSFVKMQGLFKDLFDQAFSKNFQNPFNGNSIDVFKGFVSALKSEENLNKFFQQPVQIQEISDTFSAAEKMSNNKEDQIQGISEESSNRIEEIIEEQAEQEITNLLPKVPNIKPSSTSPDFINITNNTSINLNLSTNISYDDYSLIQFFSLEQKHLHSAIEFKLVNHMVEDIFALIILVIVLFIFISVVRVFTEKDKVNNSIYSNSKQDPNIFDVIIEILHFAILLAILYFSIDLILLGYPVIKGM